MRSLDQRRADRADSITDLHRDCFACGCGEDGLGLRFEVSEADTVSAQWFCEPRLQGYPGIVHGGIVATILDCAMTNCLLMKGTAAVTADMHVKYHEPVRIGEMITVTATLVRSRPPLYALEAEVVQNGRVKASASARFMREHVWSDGSNV